MTNTNTDTISPTFKYKGKIDYSTRRSKLSIKILKYFLEKRNEEFPCFGAILDKYCEIGMSKLYVKKVIEELTGGTISIRPNTLDEAIKVEMAKGRTNFYFHARTPNNPFHLNRGIKRKSVPMSGNRNVQFVCLACQHKFTNKIHVTNDGFIGLRKRTCPKCEKQSKLVACFHFKNKNVYKAVIDERERFVTSEKNKLIPIGEHN